MKWVVVVALVAGGIYGNWYYQDQSLFNRVLAIVLMAVVAVLIAAQTVRGKATWLLLKEARIEIRRVVWPTRPETTQTTFIVLALVLVFSLILWALDSGLSFLVSTVIG
ncbi:MAG: preprotein translocase subunit SecE [Pseudomonadales bacterium]|nr:preprotein translocase subunit SecE [Pseudomonadales bacterium]